MTGVRGRGSVVAVVDADDTQVLVWWVNVGERLQNDFSRLCGAWSLDPAADNHAVVLEGLTYARVVLPTTTGAQALSRAGIDVDRLLDVAQTVAAAVAARNAAQELFDTEQAKRKASTRMKEPHWPSFPDPLDVDHPPAWDVNDPDEDHQDTALSVAHWLAALCSQWEDLEEERLGRPMLRKAFGDVRTLPVALVGETS